MQIIDQCIARKCHTYVKSLGTYMKNRASEHRHNHKVNPNILALQRLAAPCTLVSRNIRDAGPAPPGRPRRTAREFST